jgi:hypothetical protein
MSDKQFTAGPWRVDPNYNCDVQSADGALEIASTHPDVLDGGPSDTGKAKANARLIAKAPDLLRIASDLLALVHLKYGNLDEGVNEIIRDASAVISTARGDA